MVLANHEPMPNPRKGAVAPSAPSARYDTLARVNAPHRSATHHYQRAQVESASPTRLIVLLYEGAIRFCSLAQDAMHKGDLETQNVNLIRAQRIVAELLASLNRTAGGEVALNLARIYTHMLAELVRSNLYDDGDAVGNVITLLTEMRASWIEIDRLQSADADGLSEQGPDNSREPAAQEKRTAARAALRPVRPIAKAIQPAPTRNSVQRSPGRLEDRLA
jgi:flagellar protein FliS